MDSKLKCSRDEAGKTGDWSGSRCICLPWAAGEGLPTETAAATETQLLTAIMECLSACHVFWFFFKKSWEYGVHVKSLNFKIFSPVYEWCLPHKAWQHHSFGPGLHIVNFETRWILGTSRKQVFEGISGHVVWNSVIFPRYYNQPLTS